MLRAKSTSSSTTNARNCRGLATLLTLDNGTTLVVVDTTHRPRIRAYQTAPPCVIASLLAARARPRRQRDSEPQELASRLASTRAKRDDRAKRARTVSGTTAPARCDPGLRMRSDPRHAPPTLVIRSEGCGPPAPRFFRSRAAPGPCNHHRSAWEPTSPTGSSSRSAGPT